MKAGVARELVDHHPRYFQGFKSSIRTMDLQVYL